MPSDWLLTIGITEVYGRSKKDLPQASHPRNVEQLGDEQLPRDRRWRVPEVDERKRRLPRRRLCLSEAEAVMKFEVFISHEGKTSLLDVEHTGTEDLTRGGRTAAAS
jgi:hypothetical protein